MYTASADWMTRNLDRRVEVATPIIDPDIFRELRDIIDLQLADNVKARWLDKEQSNVYKQPLPGQRRIRAQIDTYRYLKQKVQKPVERK